MMLVTLLLAIVAMAVVVMVPAYRRLLEQCCTADKYRDDFFGAANALVEDERVPDVIAFTIAGMARNLRNPRILRSFVRQLLKGSHRTDPKWEKLFFEAVVGMPEDAQRRLYGALANFSIAITYNNIVLGWFVRRVTWAMKGGAKLPRPAPEDARLHAVLEAAGSRDDGCSRELQAA